MKSDFKRDFKGVWIPKEIYLNKELSAVEKIMIAEINSLDEKESNGCYASNDYFAEFLDISKSRVADILTKLRKSGLIYTANFNGRKRFLKVKNIPKYDIVDIGGTPKNGKADFLKTGRQTSYKQEGRLPENRNHINIVYKYKYKIKEREKKFKEQVLEFHPQYSSEMLNNFFNYWSEQNKSGTKMLFELKPTWDLSKRLNTWARNEGKFKGGKKEKAPLC